MLLVKYRIKLVYVQAEVLKKRLVDIKKFELFELTRPNGSIVFRNMFFT